MTLVCAGCGWAAPPDDPAPFRCPAAGTDGRDHVLGRTDVPEGATLAGDDPNPFVRFRTLSYAWQVGRRRGLADADFVALVRALDAAVADVDGHGFAVTPYRRVEALGAWVKDETGNVSGSHKARHLVGLAIWLEVAERVGLVAERRPLAIASCGNAALAAAVVARAAGRPLQVFVPTWAEASVLDRLAALGAHIEACPRRPGDPPGDPCVRRFRAAVDDGALPFCCQGTDNGLTIDGGMTLGFELAVQDAALGKGPLDRLFVQVGGGALASATSRALAWAHALGANRPPALHAVQTEGGWPLVRAWRGVARGLVERLGGEAGDDASMANWIAAHADEAAIEAAVHDAAGRRGAFLWPWEEEPRSAATGILDDDTWDGLAVVRGMLLTGGWPVVAREATILRARDEGRAATGLNVSATGTAGLAGALELQGRIGPDERVAVLFTGVQR